MSLQIFQPNIFQGIFMSSFKPNLRGTASLKRFQPSQNAKAPEIARLQAREVPFRPGSDQIIAANHAEFKKFARHQGTDGVLADVIEDLNSEAPVDIAERNMLTSAIEEALDDLNPRERDLLRMRFGLDDGLPRTLEEVGREFGVTRERIRQIETKTLAKLRNPQHSQKLRDYFDLD